MDCCNVDREKDIQAKESKDRKFTTDDIGNLPVKRGLTHCTDVWCLGLLIAAWVAWILATVAGFADGDPTHLYLPRDYSGGYCDTETNWNNGANTKGFSKQSFTMNVSATTDVVVKQFMCSSAVKDIMTDGTEKLLKTEDEIFDYLCSCCLVPCGHCDGSFSNLGDISNPQNLASTISGKLDDLRGLTDPSSLYYMRGANGDVFMDMWNQVDQFFNKVCLTTCAVNFGTMNSSTHRDYTYSLAPDNMMSNAFEKLKNADVDSTVVRTAQSTIRDSFTFKALPKEVCPYEDTSKCVPMPGIDFEEVSAGYCSFKMNAQVVQTIGTAAADAFVGIGAESLANSLSESFSTWLGDFQRSLDVFVLVIIVSFVIGFTYLIMLRLCVGTCVWLSIFAGFLILAVGGYSCWVRAHQCEGTSFVDSGTQMGAAVLITAKSGITSIGGQQCNEDIEGKGYGYTGCQEYTKGLNHCIRWGEASSATILSSYSQSFGAVSAGGNAPASVYDSRLNNNYCRNPCDVGDLDCAAKTIWCFTSNADQAWEECLPVGVILPECDNGHVIKSKELRAFLEISAYILWAMSVIFIIFVICFTDRIRLAIRLSKVAAVFISHNWLVVLVPAVQSLVASLWCLAWVLSASFLLSQVPSSAVPTDAYVTYAEAYGTADTPGKCTSTWPSGFVYKDESNCVPTNGTYACWRCAPPRYIFDERFVLSFFVFLWNNAFMIAIGQFVVAAACCGWFFTPNNEKGRTGVIRQALKWTCFHAGSLAFGSFIIATVQLIRYIVYYLQKQAAAQRNRIMVLVFRILGCCIWCFEKCLKFLNENAYIQVALKGTNFCVSAKNALYLIMRNPIRYGVVAVLGKGIRLIGILFITAGTGALGYLGFIFLHPDMNPAVNVIIYIVVGFLVSNLFVNVFGLAVGTVLQCFLACEEAGTVLTGPTGYLPQCLEGWVEETKELEVQPKPESETAQ